MKTAIRRALVSVSDKTGLVELARELHGLGIELLSTGGTARALREASVPVREVSEWTGFPEMLDGRVKTLHPRVHGGLLYLRDNPEHCAQAKTHGIDPIDLLVVNLYPFERTVADPGVKLEEAVENIDIGGPAMLRAAAKNYRHVVVLTDPADYAPVLAQIRERGDVDLETRQNLCAKTFARTADYDAAIDAFLARRFCGEEVARLNLRQGKTLRYGENAHQQAALYLSPGTCESSAARARVLHGKEMSYNNYVDADAALEAAKDLWDHPAAAIIKHTNPCGYATGRTLSESLEAAWAGDPVSAYGSVIACTRRVDLEAARFLKGRFVEVLLAPGYEADALEFLRTKSQDIRLLEVDGFTGFSEPRAWRSVTGGMLGQSRDTRLFDALTCATARPFPAGSEFLTRFAVAACKHTRSNAIVLAREYRPGCCQVIGMGAGQPNRIDSLRKLAYPRALENLRTEHGALPAPAPDFDAYAREQIARAVLASDAFFPFDDTVRAAAQLGIRLIVQPGGAKRDPDSVRACDELGLSMAFTGTRHFKH